MTNKQDEFIKKACEKLNLFDQLPPENLKILKTLLRVEIHPKHAVLFHEGDKGRSLYFLVEGKAAVFKDSNGESYCLKKMNAPEIIGEMSFIDGVVRSATIKTLAASTFVVFDHEILSHYPDLLKQVTLSIVQKALQRLRHSNEKYTESLQKQLDQERLRNEFGIFFIIMTLLMLASNAINHIAGSYHLEVKDSWFSWAYIGLMLVPFLGFVFYFKYPLGMFGVTLNNFKKSLLEGLILGAGLSAIFFVSFDVLEEYIPQLKDQLALNGPRRLAITIIITYFVHSYIQEFIARGLIQTSLRKFFNDTKGYKTIMLVAVMFGAFHLHFGFIAVLLTTFISIVFGLFYMRHNNLIGVTVLHFILGMTASYLGFI
jgi:CRP-like cAMP-binding protein/membrane protease YdiL (CAAX protease family)